MVNANLLTDINYTLPKDLAVAKEFAKPIFENKFYLSKAALIGNAKIVEFNKGIWERNPFLFSYEQYDIHIYANVILLVNSVPSFILFIPDRLPKIVVPNIRTINKILSYREF
jgi:hypothetical protein